MLKNGNKRGSRRERGSSLMVTGGEEIATEMIVKEAG
jgi:hypothetical protein